MDQFDQAIQDAFSSNQEDSPATLCVVGGDQATISLLRANLEVEGHKVICVPTHDAYEAYLMDNSVEIALVCCNSKQVNYQSVIETTTLLSTSTVAVGFSSNPSYEVAIEFIRMGGADFYKLPEELSAISSRVQHAITQARINQNAAQNTSAIINLCNQLNEERHRIEDEKDNLCNDLANSYCATEKQMQQVAMTAEFKTLINQELDIESMLRTALGYLLTRIGATNIAVYLREGDIDWGVGAFVNYDRQPEQFQSLLDQIKIATCTPAQVKNKLNRYVDGEVFANTHELDIQDFSGTDVIVASCFHNQRCMAVITMFRSDAKPFSCESVEAVETLRHIFGAQVGSILRIHNRATGEWSSESVDDDDRSFDQAA